MKSILPIIAFAIITIAAKAQPGEGLTRTPDFNESAVGLLPLLLTNTRLQTEAVYGYRTVGLGDINGDGFDDAAVSGPGTLDLIAGPVTLADAGAVFLYFGSPAGLPSVPSLILRSPVPVANAMFGYSITSGNVTGNSLPDLIIGAPGESYTTAVGGSPATATVTAGKVYVYDGQDISNGIVNNPASVFLQGALHFSNGIAGAGSNVSINALFGFSVATTEDMNGDNLSEIIAGAPGYAAAQLIPVRTGAAFIVYSNDITSNSITRLNAPSLLLFPPEAVNLSGLLFGFSVDGAGDYNRDGFPDVVVGAPGGVSLGGAGVLGGSAYIFNGNGNGFQLNPATQLKSAGSLLQTAGDLFGFKVKGLRNNLNSRSGNVIISAPSANSISNVITGLRLKTGSLQIFRGKSNPTGVETPIQTLVSPRSSSLLSVLAGQNLQVAALTGADLDNIGDINCDGYADLIAGEPLSTKVGLINTDIAGGSAFIYLGLGDGTFTATPSWELANSVSTLLGVNAASLLGYTVSGAGKLAGASGPISVLAGAPGAAFGYNSGVLQLGNTIATTSNFAAGDNGLGKAYSFSVTDCSLLSLSNTTPARRIPISEKRQMLAVYPVVTSGTLTAEHFSSLYEGRGQMILLNAQGICLERYPLPAKTGRSQLNINISKYPAGLYYLQVRGNDYKTPAVKIIKQ